MPRAIAATVVALTAASALRCGSAGARAGVISASGHVEATEVRVSTKVGGTVEALLVEEGDRPARGQEIARIDATDVRLALDAARAEMGQATAELSLRLAGAREEDIAEAQAQVARAQAELEAARRDLGRMEGLMASGSGTTKALDDAGTRRDVASASLDAARERLRKLRAGNRPQEIESARARAAAAAARIAQLEQQLRDAVIASPIAGVVTEKLVEAGELATPGTALVVLVDLDSPWLTVFVAEPDLGRIRIGQEAEVVTDGGQARKGRISFVASRAEFTPKNVQTRDERVKLVYEVKIGLENRDGLFKPGMPAEARITPVGEPSEERS